MVHKVQDNSVEESNNSYGDMSNDQPTPPAAPPRLLSSIESNRRKLPPSITSSMPDTYLTQGLSVTVLGASGDLAKKKTFPALLDLFAHGLLPQHVVIAAYARSDHKTEEFRKYVADILRGKASDDVVQAFVLRVEYFRGGYGSEADFGALAAELIKLEEASLDSIVRNRLFYFAVPPDVFIPAGRAIKHTCTTALGWNRLIIEKPFGHDFESAKAMSDELRELWPEESLYRIDHYLGKEMVQNLMLFRFGNMFLEPLLNRNYVAAVQITFKEDFGTMGRGGYFDGYGIIRDIIQNHLMQVLSLVAMEPPVRVVGRDAAEFVRSSKVEVLRSIPPLTVDDVVLGQYAADESGNNTGYLDDPTVPAGSVTPTFCVARLNVRTPRWDGVPFILKAGKALEERKGEIRIQFKDAPASDFMFDRCHDPATEGGKGQECFHLARNELVLRLQPAEAVYLKVNLKAPGLGFDATQSELDLSYNKRYKDAYNPDAYARLLLEVLRGNQSSFVRTDELLAAWKIFTPLLHHIEGKAAASPVAQGAEADAEKRKADAEARGVGKPLLYPYGSRGPREAEEFIASLGMKRTVGYTWNG